ncbi:hypothetical protein ACJJTC_017500 [Scirpophaga incertulas]
MKIWNWVCLVLCLHQPCVRSLLPGINVLKIIPEILGPTATDYTDTTTSAALSSDTENTTTTSTIYLETENLDTGLPPHYVDQEFQEPLDELISIEPSPEPPDKYPVQYAGKPGDLQVNPLPLIGSDHELMFNISWEAPLDSPARDYSLEVRSLTDTLDCKTPLMCYEYNIPGDVLWWLIPAYASTVAESCAVRPGCTYVVLLTAHPWDGHTVSEKIVQLDGVSGMNVELSNSVLERIIRLQLFFVMVIKCLLNSWKDDGGLLFFGLRMLWIFLFPSGEVRPLEDYIQCSPLQVLIPGRVW